MHKRQRERKSNLLKPMCQKKKKMKKNITTTTTKINIKIMSQVHY